jgi:hypothetical protein
LCYAIRRSLLANIRLETDGSGSLDAQAAKSVASAALPCPVFAYEVDGRIWLRFVLSGPPFRFEIGDPADLDPEVAAADARTTSIGSPGGAEIREAFFRADVDQSEAGPGWSTLQSIGHELGRQVREETERLVSERETWLGSYGYRAQNMPLATGGMAPQFDLVRRGSFPTEARRLNPEDLREDMETCARLILPAPDGVESVMQVARLLWVHGWEEWQFLTTAAHYATLAMETSMRLAFEAALGPSPALTGMRDGGPATAEGIRTYEGMRKETQGWTETRIDGRPLPRSKPALAYWLADNGVLTRWEARAAGDLLSLRDMYSHPDFAAMHFIGGARDTIQNSALLINVAWARIEERRSPGDTA